MENITLNNTTYIYTNITKDFNNSSSDYDYYYSDDYIFQVIQNHIAMQYYHWIFMILFAFVFCAGVAGNFLVCYTVYKHEYMKSITNKLLVNLATADLLVLLCCLPITISYDILKSWFLGEFMCKAVTYTQVL